MQPDLLHRARSAANEYDEVDAIQNACTVLAPNQPGLILACKEVRQGRMPRPVLLGVVAELAPSPDWSVDCATSSAIFTGRQVWGATVALALLIAILEASHAHRD